MGTREQMLTEFAQVIANAVADALRQNPPTALIPEALTQALLRIAAQPVQPPRPVTLDPISAMQQSLQLQGQQQGLFQLPGGQPRPYQVVRIDDNGTQYVQDVTIPQLLAEMCDLLHDQCAMLEEMATKPRRRRKKDAVAFG